MSGYMNTNNSPVAAERTTELEASSRVLDSMIPVQDIEDIVIARQKGRFLAQELKFSPTQSTLVTTVISELARNIILYANNGIINLSSVNDGARSGVRIVANDNGPGIEDISRALISGYSSSGGLGLGLPGVKQLADEFQIESTVGQGTTVSVLMWMELKLNDDSNFK